MIAFHLLKFPSFSICFWFFIRFFLMNLKIVPVFVYSFYIFILVFYHLLLLIFLLLILVTLFFFLFLLCFLCFITLWLLLCRLVFLYSEYISFFLFHLLPLFFAPIFCLSLGFFFWFYRCLNIKIGFYSVFRFTC